MSAVYTPVERQIMSALPVKEQAFVHTLKALTDGEISTGVEQSPSAGAASVQVGQPVEPVYTNPEDLEFGKPAPRQKLYAVVWTGGHRRCKTKDGKKDRHSAARTIKAWLRWKERQGWQVTAGSQGAGWYIATKEGDRQAISLREYDKQTLERI